MKYVSPVVEVSELSIDDVVMVSGLEIKPEGSLPETDWDDIGK